MSLRAEALRLERKGKPLLQSVSAELGPGMFVALLGPNGAGKSTLVRCLSGVLYPTEGRVTLKGTELATLTGSQRMCALSYLPQHLETPFAFTVSELLCLNGTRFDRAHPALGLLELYPLLELPLNHLSGGERQRAAVARALLAETPFLLLDEPLAHLDLKYTLRLLEYLARQARNGRGVLAVIHDIRLARRFATHLWLLNHGELLFDGEVKDLGDALLEQAFGLNASDLLIFS